MDRIRKLGKFSVNMDLLETLRQRVLCIAIVLLVAFVKPFPVVMVIGSLLGMFYVALEWRRIGWRDWWPLGLLVLAYIIAVLNIRGPLDPELHKNTNWVELQVGFALIPFMFVGLRPSRRWGTTWVMASASIFTVALIVATVKSFQTVDGGIRFIPYSLYYYGQEGVSIWNSLRTGYSFYSYWSLARSLNIWPMYMSFCFVLGLLVVMHRLFSERKRVWMRIALIVYFLLGVFLANSRGMYFCLMVLALVVFGRMLVCRSYRPVPLFTVLAVFVGIVVLFFVGSRGKVAQGTSSGDAAGRFSQFIESLDGKLKNDPRIRLWTHSWKERDAFLPWGLGSGSVAAFIKEYYYEKYGDSDGDHHFDDANRRESTITKLHNTYLDTMVEQGYLGFLYLLIMLIIPIVRIPRLQFVHLLLYASLLVLMMFESTVYDDFSIYYFCAVYCAIIAFSTGTNAEESTSKADIAPQATSAVG